MGQCASVVNDGDSYFERDENGSSAAEWGSSVMKVPASVTRVRSSDASTDGNGGRHSSLPPPPIVNKQNSKPRLDDNSGGSSRAKDTQQQQQHLHARYAPEVIVDESDILSMAHLQQPQTNAARKKSSARGSLDPQQQHSGSLSRHSQRSSRPTSPPLSEGAIVIPSMISGSSASARSRSPRTRESPQTGSRGVVAKSVYAKGVVVSSSQSSAPRTEDAIGPSVTATAWMTKTSPAFAPSFDTSFFIPPSVAAQASFIVELKTEQFNATRAVRPRGGAGGRGAISTLARMEDPLLPSILRVAVGLPEPPAPVPRKARVEAADVTSSRSSPDHASAHPPPAARAPHPSAEPRSGALSPMMLAPGIGADAGDITSGAIVALPLSPNFGSIQARKAKRDEAANGAPVHAAFTPSSSLSPTSTSSNKSQDATVAAAALFDPRARPLPLRTGSLSTLKNGLHVSLNAALSGAVSPNGRNPLSPQADDISPYPQLPEVA